jgi:hypothetical protein
MNSLITEISQNLPQPSDFGVGSSEYTVWKNEIERLGQIPEQYNYTVNLYGAAAFFGGIFLLNTNPGDWGWILFLLIFIGFPAMVGGRGYATEYERVIDQIKELKNKKSKVDSEYWSAKRSHIDKALSQYKEVYLYRKRTDSYGFLEKLQTYSDAVEHFSGDYRFFLEDHKEYVRSRNIAVVPYKRPLQQNLDKSDVTNDIASIQSNRAIREVKQNPITVEDLELVLESIATDIPSQHVEKQINNSNSQSFVDIQGQEKSNMIIGDIGEEAVADYERNLLQKSGRNYLADRVEVVSKTIGDGLGYDVLSFDQYGNEKFIEVKTTKSNSSTANFTFTRGELNFLTKNPDTAFVYCVFGVTQNNPRLKIYPAKQFLNKSFEPVEYRSSVW